jgi:hypothetical protein
MPIKPWMQLIVLTLTCATAIAQEEYDREPIRYSASQPDNLVSQLDQQLASGSTKLQFDDDRGYLQAVLQALSVPQSSQVLVFSKTSLQRQRITPKTPRAVYFSDDVYVGYCQRGDVLEISAVDPQLGTVFYTLDQQRTETPRFKRQGDSCLICHSSGNTQNVPGHVIRSLFTDRSGQPILSEGSHRVDHTTPFEQRWGGWYVTGTHGGQKHMGNVTHNPRDIKELEPASGGQNITDLQPLFRASHYLTPHSDLVALMVLEHQAQTHNYITRASFTVREALYYQQNLNRDLDEAPDHRWPSTDSRIASAGNALLKYLLFCEEAPLAEPIAGTSAFAAEFAALGPRDSKGRSLRDLDCQRRLFKYPCSYLIYSKSFDALHPEMRDYVLTRLLKILTGEDPDPTFAHLTPEDRQAILEILRDTKPNLPEAWRTAALR